MEADPAAEPEAAAGAPMETDATDDLLMFDAQATSPAAPPAAPAPATALAGVKRKRESEHIPDDRDVKRPKMGTPILHVIKNKTGDWTNEAPQVKTLRKNFVNLHKFLTAARNVSFKSLATANWNYTLKRAEVVVMKGKNFAVHGHTIDGKRYLFPEEAAMLMERSALDVHADGVPISLQQMYALMHDAGVPMDVYHVYTHMMRAGYVVCRRGFLQERAEERQRKAREQEEARARRNAKTTAAAAAAAAAAAESLADPEGDEAPAVLLSATDRIDDAEAIAARSIATPRAPSLAWRAAAWLGARTASLFSWITATPFRTGALVRPGTDLEGTRATLAITKTVSAAMHVGPGAVVPPPDLASFAAQTLTINFDCYERTRGFKLSNPGPPMCRIAVCCASWPFPPMAAMETLLASSHPVPLKIAVVQGGNICFFALDDIVLPEVWFEPGTPEQVAALEAPHRLLLL